MSATIEQHASTAPNLAFTTGELAAKVGARLVGPSDATITGLAAVHEARNGELTFISDRRYAAQWGKSAAAAAVVAEGLDLAADSRPLLMVRDVEQAMIPLLTMFQPPDDLPEVGVHPSAVVHPTATLGRAVRVGPLVTIGAHVSLGDGVVLHPGVRLYAGVTIGAGSVLHANTVVRERCSIGRGVILHQSVSIGDGFGYRPSPDGRGLLKMPHIGTVIIEDGVEIGANSCVDRAKFGATVVGMGTKIDNQVQVAHNCRLGRCCLMAGQSGLGGSTVLGDGVIIAGAAGVIDHITIGSGAQVGAMALVTRDIPAGAKWAGHPADEGRATLKQWAAIRKLPALLRHFPHVAGESKANGV
jgi:UDP-3-O-[3-hydroxymyristoyl] glucosamine N-acyltransferase